MTDPAAFLASVRTESVSPRGVFSITHSGSPDSERAFLCGSLVMPTYRVKRIPGVACLVAVLEQDSLTFVLDAAAFTAYDDPLAKFFSDAYDRFKVSDYAVRQSAAEDLETVRFWQEMAKRQYQERDKVFPSVRKIEIATDTQAFTPLLSLGQDRKLKIGPALIQSAIGAYDPERPFSDAPPEIQALCLALNFAAARAWPAFEADRLARLEPKTPEDFF